MKILLLVLTMILAPVQAKMINGTIEEIACGEFDYMTGDACIIAVYDREDNRFYGLVYSNYDWIYEYEGNVEELTDYYGRKVMVESCYNIPIGHTRNILEAFNENYFYLSCELNGFHFIQ